MSDRDKKGRFQPGVSGNPQGKRSGIKQGFKLFYEEHETRVYEVIKEMLYKKKDPEANERAVQMLLDRAVPKIKAIEFRPEDDQAMGFAMFVGNGETGDALVTTLHGFKGNHEVKGLPELSDGNGNGNKHGDDDGSTQS